MSRRFADCFEGAGVAAGDLDGGPGFEDMVHGEAWSLTEEDVDAWTDAVWAGLIRAVGADYARYPQTAAALREVAYAARSGC